MRPAIVAVCAAASLATAGAASAHVVPQPSFLEAGGTATIAFDSPNERDEPMTGFRVRVPADLRIVGAHGPDGWRADESEREATWSGGALPPEAEATFHVSLEAPSEPGRTELEAEQLYPGGEVARWPVQLLVVPAEETAGSDQTWAFVVALLLGLVTAAIVAVAWLRRRGAESA